MPFIPEIASFCSTDFSVTNTNRDTMCKVCWECSVTVNCKWQYDLLFNRFLNFHLCVPFHCFVFHSLDYDKCLDIVN
jgi:hypothetical protein